MTVSNMALYHVPLYRYAFANLDTSSLNGLLTFVTLLIVVGMATAIVLQMIAFVSVAMLKPLCMLAALLNACALYFVVTYSVILDRSMMGNVLNTRSEESLDFVNPTLVLYVVFLGILPAWLISRVRIAQSGRLRLLTQTAGILVVGLIAIYLNSPTWLWFDEHSKRLGGMIMPWSYAVNTLRATAAGETELQDLKLLPPATLSNNERLLVVLVIGETARSSNFSLYGYERRTNPLLENAGVAVLQGAKACSTYTTASLHCMLSHDGSRSGSDEALPSYLQRHGVDVIWRSNNWGEPPLAVETYEKASALRRSCEGDRCDFDDVMLNGLGARINESVERKTFVVLHTKGSHGPSYHSRYPADFDVFKPACQSVELDKCDDQSLINAYDNSILYTDDFLSRAIRMLENIENTPTVFIYVSDHGESLGEYGLYLHGTPYSIAPDVQKDIPFIVWMSERFQKDRNIDVEKLEVPTQHSHGQIFHSVLGAFGLQSTIYDPKLDIFAP